MNVRQFLILTLGVALIAGGVSDQDAAQLLAIDRLQHLIPELVGDRGVGLGEQDQPFVDETPASRRESR